MQSCTRGARLSTYSMKESLGMSSRWAGRKSKDDCQICREAG